MSNPSLWARYLTVFLGVWLVVLPLTFGYNSPVMEGNDTAVGLLLILFGSLTVSGRHFWAPWVCTCLGLWLQLAPIVFWAPHGMLYLNDTVIGVLVVAFSILIPGAPGEHLHKGPMTPPGWSYNPSSYVQRMPIILFATACWFMARYMAAYQLGYRDSVYDPVFGDGTLDVITSAVSKDFPVSDAGLGAAAYTIEVLLGLHGGQRRWHTMPWGVLFFGILVVPVGFTSIILVMLQPIMVGHWCFWCLLTALFMLIMIALTVDEVVATLQYLHKVRKAKLPFWQIFWKGGEVIGDSHDEPIPALNGSFLRSFPAMVRGFATTWNLLLSALLGLWMMATPSVFGSVGLGADVNYVVGALTVVVSVVSLAEVTRALRYVNIVLGLWIAISAWLIWDTPPDSMISDTIVGILLIALCIPRGKIYNEYGSWDRYIF